MLIQRLRAGVGVPRRLAGLVFRQAPTAYDLSGRERRPRRRQPARRTRIRRSPPLPPSARVSCRRRPLSRSRLQLLREGAQPQDAPPWQPSEGQSNRRQREYRGLHLRQPAASSQPCDHWPRRTGGACARTVFLLRQVSPGALRTAVLSPAGRPHSLRHGMSADDAIRSRKRRSSAPIRQEVPIPPTLLDREESKRRQSEGHPLPRAHKQGGWRHCSPRSPFSVATSPTGSRKRSPSPRGQRR